MAPSRIDSFELEPGVRLAGKYVVRSLLGRGWEGEVYEVRERGTGAIRAAKLFFPQRNRGDRALRAQARRLEKLRDCPIVVKYHSTEHVDLDGLEVTALISELVQGELLEDFLESRPGGRLEVFEALHVLRTLAAGLEPIHDMRHYHGDVHQGNVMLRRRGLHFDVKLIDTYDWGRPRASLVKEDVYNLVVLLSEMLGGRRRYRHQPPEVKAICQGLRRDRVARKFPRAGKLRAWLDSFDWEE